MPATTRAGSRVRLIAALALVLAVAGCGTTGDGIFAPTLTSADLAKIVPGRTTASEVHALLGAPTNKAHSKDKPGETWSFKYAGSGQRRVAYIDISPDGIVSGKSDGPDFTTGAYRAF